MTHQADQETERSTQRLIQPSTVWTPGNSVVGATWYLGTTVATRADVAQEVNRAVEPLPTQAHLDALRAQIASDVAAAVASAVEPLATQADLAAARALLNSVAIRVTCISLRQTKRTTRGNTYRECRTPAPIRSGCRTAELALGQANDGER